MRHLTLAFALIVSFTALAQAPPEAINYNGVARDANGDPVADATIGLQLTIMQGDPITGTAVYAETHTTTTDAFGLFNVAIGFGTATSGTFAAIDWSIGDHHLAVALDITGGTDYVAMGSTQLLSVPYALYARSAGNQQYQTLSLSNDTLYLTNGGFVVMPPPQYTQVSFPAPTVVTTPATNISTINAVLGGTISGINSNQIIARGVVCGINPNPTYNTLTNVSTEYYPPNDQLEGSGLFTFTSGPPYLQPGQVYYYRAFAVTENHLVFYGNELTMTASIPTQNTGSGVTYNGYNYASVVLGNGQEWMSENLRSSRFANGDTITHWIQGMALSDGIPAYGHYNSASSNNSVYGKLYNGYAIMDSRNVCPLGWHVPTKSEFDLLIAYYGGSAMAGQALKDTTSNWLSPNLADNSSGFSGQPGGMYSSGNFFGLGTDANFWTSTYFSPTFQWPFLVRLSNSANGAGSDYVHRSSFLSVRCIKD
jgi:uncharacterized protein (TIGR02145 family)